MYVLLFMTLEIRFFVSVITLSLFDDAKVVDKISTTNIWLIFYLPTNII